jgi:hypothetical protein
MFLASICGQRNVSEATPYETVSEMKYCEHVLQSEDFAENKLSVQTCHPTKF